MGRQHVHVAVTAGLAVGSQRVDSQQPRWQRLWESKRTRQVRLLRSLQQRFAKEAGFLLRLMRLLSLEMSDMTLKAKIRRLYTVHPIRPRALRPMPLI